MRQFTYSVFRKLRTPAKFRLFNHVSRITRFADSERYVPAFFFPKAVPGRVYTRIYAKIVFIFVPGTEMARKIVSEKGYSRNEFPSLAHLQCRIT